MNSTQFNIIEYLIQRLYLEGVEDVVISPGSRNAPIIEAFVSYDKFTLHSIVDERSAAFFALGCTINTKKPTVIVCTSGSAVLNYAPGIAEAFYQGRPLIVISADRPENFVGQMAGQTIDQQNVLASFSKDFQQLRFSEDFSFTKRKIEDALFSMNQNLSGPIHFNMPLQEPFYGYEYQFHHDLNPVKYYNYSQISSSVIEDLKTSWGQHSQIMILCGCLDPNPLLEKELERLSQDPRVIIFCETTSNLNLTKGLYSIDNLLVQTDGNTKKYSPELLITLGRNVVSKKIKVFLKNNKIKEHWSFDQENHMIDTFNSLSHKININPTDILNNLEISTIGTYHQLFSKLEGHSRSIQKNYLKDLEFCDYKCFDIILNNLPKDCIVHYANSSVVRYSNLFDLRCKNYTSFANRGTSGIDGSTSTAVGYASKSNKLNVLITGDISFLYDSNGLWNQNYPNNLKIIVINNGGGGIFDIIEGARNSIVNKDYLRVYDKTSTLKTNYYSTKLKTIKSNSVLKEQITLILNNKLPLILEANTIKSNNSKLLLSFVKELVNK